MGGECQWHEPTLRRRDTSRRVARQGRRERVESLRPPSTKSPVPDKGAFFLCISVAGFESTTTARGCCGDELPVAVHPAEPQGHLPAGTFATAKALPRLQRGKPADGRKAGWTNGYTVCPFQGVRMQWGASESIPSSTPLGGAFKSKVPPFLLYDRRDMRTAVKVRILRFV